MNVTIEECFGEFVRSVPKTQVGATGGVLNLNSNVLAASGAFSVRSINLLKKYFSEDRDDFLAVYRATIQPNFLSGIATAAETWDLVLALADTYVTGLRGYALRFNFINAGALWEFPTDFEFNTVGAPANTQVAYKFTVIPFDSPSWPECDPTALTLRVSVTDTGLKIFYDSTDTIINNEGGAFPFPDMGNYLISWDMPGVKFDAARAGCRVAGLEYGGELPSGNFAVCLAYPFNYELLDSGALFLSDLNVPMTKKWLLQFIDLSNPIQSSGFVKLSNHSYPLFWGNKPVK